MAGAFLAPFSYLVDNKAEREENHLVDLAVADSAGTHDGQGVLSVARRTDEKRSLRFSCKEIFGGVASDGLSPMVQNFFSPPLTLRQNRLQCFTSAKVLSLLFEWGTLN
jgi:hypothetical protein